MSSSPSSGMSAFTGTMGFEDLKLSPNASGKVHPLFQEPDADVTFESSDGVRFNVHRKYLEVNTSAFPGAEFETNGEITPLSERSVVLELLFQFVYPRRHPDLDEKKLPFTILADLAEAAEKYEVFAAVGVCKMQMRRFMETNPLEVLAYATRHDYPQIITDVVPHLARRPSLEIAELLPPRLLLPWIRYRSTWDALFDDRIEAVSKMTVCGPNPSRRHIAFGMSMPSSDEPQACSSCILSVIKQLQELKAITKLKDLNAALAEKKKKGMTKNKKCQISVCQYDFILDKNVGGIQEKKEGITFLVR